MPWRRRGEWMYRSTFPWSWADSRPGRFNTGKKAHCTHWIPYRDSNFDTSVFRSEARRCTDCAPAEDSTDHTDYQFQTTLLYSSRFLHWSNIVVGAEAACGVKRKSCSLTRHRSLKDVSGKAGLNVWLTVVDGLRGHMTDWLSSKPGSHFCGV
jgi:hypothetical protein